MKKLLFVLAGAFLVFTVTPVRMAAASPSALLQQQTPQKTKILSGTVVKSGDHFVLSDHASKLSYILDDTEKASHYEGKNVKVTGTVDVASNTIHVVSNEEIA